MTEHQHNDTLVETKPEPTESVLARIGYDCLMFSGCTPDRLDEHTSRCQDFNVQRATYARMNEGRHDAANGVDISDHEDRRFVQVTGGTISPVSINDLRRALEHPYDDDVYGAMYAAHGGQMVHVRVVATSPVRPDDNDYLSQEYAVVSDANAVYGRFTTNIDGRA